MRPWLAVCVAGALLVPARARALDASGGKGIAQCSVQRWQVKDGLPGDSVRAIAQTASGELWIATLGALARYDGIRFARFEAPTAWRPAASDVNVLLAARDGSLWAGSPFHVPLRIRGNATSAFGAKEGLPEGEGAVAWAEDAKGQIWMAGAHGLSRFGDGRFAAHARAGLQGRRARVLAVDGDSLWVGTDRGLFSLVGETLVPHPRVPAQVVAALHQDRRRVLWAATGDQLWALEGNKSRVYGRAEGLPRGPISQITSDDDGNLWLGSPEGLARLRDGRIEIFTTRDGLPENDVTALLVDRESTLWVGTRNGGLAQFTDRTLDTHETPAALAGAQVLSVCEDDGGTLWFGTLDRGLVSWRDGRATTFTAREGLPAGPVAVVLAGERGEVWIGTGTGLARYHDGVVTAESAWPRGVAALYRDRKGALWIGGDGEIGQMSGGKLVARYDAEAGAIHQTRAIAEDAEGMLWISGVGGVLWLEGERFVRPGPLRDVRLTPVRAMRLGRDGSFFLSVERSGLMRVRKGRLEIFGPDKGLDADMLYQLLEDDAGDLWIGTNNSLLRVARSSLEAVSEGRRPTLEVVSFESTDRRAGVVASEIRHSAVWKARDGRLWFVTRQGPLVIDPRRVRTNNVRPPVQIEAVVVDGRAMPADEEARLPPGPSRLEIHYAARALLEPSKVRYRYQLEGVDVAWVEAGTRRVASYAGVRDGRYRFRVQASNNDRLWNERGASFAFVVAPPFHRTAWFYAACALAVLPLVLVFHRVRLARVRAEYVGMFSERNRMARELHDTLLQGMSAVGMQLNAIRNRLADAPEATRRDLAIVQDEVTRCLEETRRAVWDLRDRGVGGGDLGPALSRVLRRLCQAAGVPAQMHTEGHARHLPHAVEDDLFRIGREAVTNALKHARPTRLEVRLRYEPERVTLTVTDDGAGFAPDAVSPDHFGLLGMRERAARIGATVGVRSAPGEGTTVEVVLPSTHV